MAKGMQHPEGQRRSPVEEVAVDDDGRLRAHPGAGQELSESGRVVDQSLVRSQQIAPDAPQDCARHVSSRVGLVRVQVDLDQADTGSWRCAATQAVSTRGWDA